MKGISEKGRVLTFPENNAFMAGRERVLGVCVSVRWNALSPVSTWKAIYFLQYSCQSGWTTKFGIVRSINVRFCSRSRQTSEQAQPRLNSDESSYDNCFLIDPRGDFRPMRARWEPSQQGHEGLFGPMEKFFVCLYGRFHRPTHTRFILEIG